MILASVFIVLVLDQVSKAIVVATIPMGGAMWGEADSFFHFTYVRNYALIGGAFGAMPLVIYVAPLVAFGVLLYLFRHLNIESHLHSIAYGMVAGGAVGNLIDRFARRYVVDFLQFHFYFRPFNCPWKYYPAFNRADSGICIGVFFLMVGWHKAVKKDVSDIV